MGLRECVAMTTRSYQDCPENSAQRGEEKMFKHKRARARTHSIDMSWSCPPFAHCGATGLAGGNGLSTSCSLYIKSGFGGRLVYIGGVRTLQICVANYVQDLMAPIPGARDTV